MLKTLKNTKWIVACSGGPDSMALLDLCLMHGVIPIVAHVNYQKRETAKRDEALVEAYCDEKGLVLKRLYPHYETGNFQSWARNVRYDFFLELKEKYGAEGVLVAHHREDCLETYFMQKKRGSLPQYWGIQEVSYWKQMKVVRPLLNVSKQQLIQHCQSRNISFGIDESNLTDAYARNQIRHHVVDLMDEKQKQTTLEEMNRLNQAQREELAKIMPLLEKRMNLEVLFNSVNPALFLTEWIYKWASLRLSARWIEELLKQLHSKKNFETSLDDCVKLSKTGNFIEITEMTEVSYTYVLDKIEMLKTEWFEIAPVGKSTEAVTLSEDDFPITIRNVRPGDSIELRFGTKKISRWFVDRKIPKNQRKQWPVVLNRHNRIILVPHIGCDVKHYSNNPTCFVIK